MYAHCGAHNQIARNYLFYVLVSRLVLFFSLFFLVFRVVVIFRALFFPQKTCCVSQETYLIGFCV